MDAPAEAPRAGLALLQAVQLMPAVAGVRVTGVACLSGCKRGCVAALMAPGKVGYLFGDLSPDADGAADLVAAAQAHASRPDGFLPRVDRPERLRAGILARLPPLEWVAAQPRQVIEWPA